MAVKKQLSTESIIKYLNSKGIKSFWHFTDASNLETIKKYGIQSLKNIKKNKIDVNRFGANNISHDLDIMRGLDKVVHLSFIDDHPMYHVAKKDGRIINPLWLEIDINILYYKECYFCPIVANDTNSRFYSFEEIEKINFDRMFYGTFESKKEARKAEILVMDCIEKDFIKGGYYGD